MKSVLRSLGWLVVAGWVGLSRESAAQAPVEDVRLLMPRVQDYTLTGWAEGFPGHSPAAPWRRVIQTGTYALVLDTDTLRLAHLGAVPAGVGYLAAARSQARVWSQLPGADLALTVGVRGKVYPCVRGGAWTPFTGPRLIESGRFLQRQDVTDLVFRAADGTTLNVEARLETVAWPDRAALILAARPGWAVLPAGEACFGRVGGGFGLTGTNHLEIPHHPELDPEQFTLELWAYVPVEAEQATRALPWLVCKNLHEEADGNFGLVIAQGKAQARLNVGGGRDHAFSVEGRTGLRVEAWNHLAISYDGDQLRLFVNGELGGERPVGRKRVPGGRGLAFGRRQDNEGDGYHFRGVVDEIRLYARALSGSEIRARFEQPESGLPSEGLVRAWSFRDEGKAALLRPVESWSEAWLELRLGTDKGVWRQRWDQPAGETWEAREWREVSLAFDPVARGPVPPTSDLRVLATEMPRGRSCPVEYDGVRGWHRVDLDGIEPIVPAGRGPEPRNDALERVRLELANPGDREATVRLLLAKRGSGIRQRIGSPMTGISAVLRFPDGQPTGVPVQLSKNWHGRPEGGVYAGAWFHGFTQVRLPARAAVELEVALAYGHWGGVAAASHSQLCLIGWGSNQLWDQSALGSWGESICYEPDQVQAQASILDVRPLMVRSMGGDPQWQWTHNVGGGDYFRWFDIAGRRVLPSRMRAVYLRQGPCLTEVAYVGGIGENLEVSATVSLARTDDLVRGVYRLRMEVTAPAHFSRWVIFQVGADTYSYTGERKLALGNETGLIAEWDARWGGGHDRSPPRECPGRIPWLSLHEAVARADVGAWANRGVVIREWNARLGGKPALPWVVERGVQTQGTDTSTLDLVPPPGITRLEPGDFVEATIEHLVMPQAAADYYGPNAALRAALQANPNTWHLIHREAVGNDRRVELTRGELERLHPAITIRAVDDGAEFTVRGGLGYVPFTFTGLRSPRDYRLWCEGQAVDQSVHGNDYWQVDYDAGSGLWSRTYNLPAGGSQARRFRLVRGEP